MRAGTASDPPVDPKRSGIMRAIRAKDTAPELSVRRILDGLGIQYEAHAADLPGKPDIAIRDRNRVIFVHGCFWHRHEGCRKSTIPRTRKEWWGDKLTANVARDARNKDRLTELGWESLTIWECELSDQRSVADVVSTFLGRNPLPDSPRSSIPIDRPVSLAECDVPKIDGKPSLQISAPKEETAMPRKSSKAGSSRKAVIGTTTPVKDASPRKRPTKSTVKKATASSAVEAPTPTPAPNERPLPERYSAAIDAASESVTITKGSQSSTIRMQSYASVANVLDMLEKSAGVLETTASLELTEPFTGTAASITAGSLHDVASVLTDLVISIRQPAVPPQAEATKPAAKKGKPKSAKASKESAAAPVAEEASPVHSEPTSQSEETSPAPVSAPVQGKTRAKTKTSKASPVGVAKEATPITQPAAEVTQEVAETQAAPSPEAQPPAEAAPAGRKGKGKAKASKASSAVSKETAPQAEPSHEAPPPVEPSSEASAPPVQAPRTPRGKAKTSVKDKAPTSPKTAGSAAKAPAKTRKAAAKGKGAAPEPERSGDWFDRDFQQEYSGERFRLVRAEISIDPQHRRNAIGRWKKGKGLHAVGYEVLSGDKHIAWVIAEDPKSFILTGAFDLKWSQHRAMIGLLTRIGSIVAARVPA